MRVARAIDPTVWENWDNWIVLKGLTADEIDEEFARSPSLLKSMDRAWAAIDAIKAEQAE